MKLPEVKGQPKRRRYFTLLLIPNNENSMRKWRIPGVLLSLMMVLSIIGIGSMMFFAYGYFAFQGEIESLKFLRGINAAQAKQIKQLRDQAKMLETKLQTVDELDQKIRSMVGLENDSISDLSDSQQVGEGGALESLRWLKEEQAADSFTEQTTETSRRNDLELRQLVTSTSRSQEGTAQEGLYFANQVAEEFMELHQKAEIKTVKLEQLLVEVEERLDYLASIPDYWPLKGRITSTYGWRKSPFSKRKSEFHEGLDIAARVGTIVKAAGRGTVVFAGYRSGWGRVLVIDHGNGYESQYSHNSSLLVKTGDKVEKGQIVARVGNSGRSTGPHLDFRIQKDGQFIDPMTVLRE